MSPPCQPNSYPPPAANHRAHVWGQCVHGVALHTFNISHLIKHEKTRKNFNIAELLSRLKKKQMEEERRLREWEDLKRMECEAEEQALRAMERELERERTKKRREEEEQRARRRREEEEEREKKDPSPRKSPK